MYGGVNAILRFVRFVRGDFDGHVGRHGRTLPPFNERVISNAAGGRVRCGSCTAMRRRGNAIRFDHDRMFVCLVAMQR